MYGNASKIRRARILLGRLVPLHRGFDGLSGRLQSTPIATLKPTFSTDDGTGASSSLCGRSSRESLEVFAPRSCCPVF